MDGKISMATKSRCVLITGATGFLGTQITQRLLKETPYRLMVLVKGGDNETALRHLKRAWWEFPELIHAINAQIEIIIGDIRQKQLGLKKEDYLKLTRSVTHIIHTAADLRLNAPLDDLKKTNREGTLNLLELGWKIQENHGLERFSHISTAYVAGGRKGIIKEDSLTDESGFLSNYEQSKYESELEVKNSKLPTSIFRPGMIVGDSKTGYIKTFNTIYTPLKLYLSGKQRLIPIKPSEKINLIPVDYVADVVTSLTFKKDAEGLTFHLTSPYESLPTIRELITFLRDWSRENLDFQLPSPIFMPSMASFIKRTGSSKLIGNNQTRRTIETVDTLSPYFSEDREFSIKNTERLFGKFQMSWKDYLPHIMEFAAYMGFFHRSDRTVHEQILFRLKSHSRPVNYYDITDGQVKPSDTSLIRENIIKAAQSLRNLGVKKGDRVALISYNSTRYLILDVAIGLVGGVNVPIYYTSPLDEIKDILEDCSASLLFIGVPDILHKLKDYEGDVTLISFSSRSKDMPNIMGWYDFLNITDKSTSKIFAPVDFSDVATIRYTSGTTDKPRGVMFTHGKLRWMAEYIASMPPWKNRNEYVSYLSFLPLNHVVEGVMGLYGPYYTPAPLSIYFLEDFQDLPEALPKVRPNIFFSVPRFYEKVWKGVTESRTVKIYLKSKGGLTKNILKRIIKRSILKKTGLNRCVQLIAGSAPVSKNLLASYHELGIEIYNAYGLTEAPLITINQLGANRIGTVGKAIPQTRVKIAEDGEVLVKGPQVMVGYFNNADSPFEEGWLRTGDFGHLTPEGSLVISGRKKEVLVNSYGKTINPLKIESMLRDIPGIAEGLLIGEGKPYCSSLLWFDDDNIQIDVVNSGIEDINSKVSHPEEIRKWVALKNDLSIENGDLTANLKLKRWNIIRRYENVVECIYNDENAPKNILHMKNVGELNPGDDYGT